MIERKERGHCDMHGRADAATIADFLAMIAAGADDTRPHVRQAVSWALRSLGKRDAGCQERALAVAAGLAESAARRRAGSGAMR